MAILLIGRFVVVPAGGGGDACGGNGGGDGGVIEVDLSGLGPVCTLRGDRDGQNQEFATTEDYPTSAAEALNSEQAEQPEPERQDEKSIPVETPRPIPVPKSRAKPTKASMRKTLPSGQPRRVADATRVMDQSGGNGRGVATGIADTAPGSANAGSGSSVAQGDGNGGGQGKGAGPGVGAGQGISDNSGMGLAVVDEKPRITRQIEPEYPEHARRARIGGRVVTRFLVTAEGRVTHASIVSAQPAGIFDKAVLEALDKWTFHPAQLKGKSVAAWVMLPVKFDLKH
jgi:protein TonB